MAFRPTFQILGAIFLVMTLGGAFLLKNPPAGLQTRGMDAGAASKSAAIRLRIQPREMLRTPDVLSDVGGYRAGLLRRPDGDQPTGAVRQEAWAFAAAALSTMTLVVGAFGNASGRILSGWMSDRLGRINVLRTMIGISMVAMPALYAAGGNVAALYSWRCSSSTGATARSFGERRRGRSDFWGTKTPASITACCSPPGAWPASSARALAERCSTSITYYQAAFYAAAVLAAVALVCEMLAKRPSAPTARPGSLMQASAPAR